MKRSRSVSGIQADMPLIEVIIAIKGDPFVGLSSSVGICDIDRVIAVVIDLLINERKHR